MADTETLGYYWCLRHQPYLQQKDALIFTFYTISVVTVLLEYIDLYLFLCFHEYLRAKHFL